MSSSWQRSASRSAPLQLGCVRERQRHLGKGHVGRRPRVGDHPVRDDPERRHQAGPDQRGLAAAGRAEHRDDRALAAAARRVDELAELVDLAVAAEEHRGVRLVEGAQAGVRRPGRVPARLLVEAERGERRADPLGVDGVRGDLQPLQVRGERVRVAAVDQQREDRLAQPAGQRQLGVAPLAGVGLRRGEEDDRVAGVEVREQLVAPGLPGDQPARRVEVEEDRLVAELGQGVLHLRRERVVGGGVGHEQLRHDSPPPRRPAGGRAIITAEASPVKINGVSEEPAATPDPAPERPSRYDRNFGGLLAAMVVTVLFVAAYVGFRALTRDQPDLEPAVDYASCVAYLQEADVSVVYPQELPSGWRRQRDPLRPGQPTGLAASACSPTGRVRRRGPAAGRRRRPADAVRRREPQSGRGRRAGQRPGRDGRGRPGRTRAATTRSRPS